MTSAFTVLVANRGEIALRILRAAQTLGMRTVAVHSADDAQSLHVSRADRATVLPGTGPAGYLDVAAVVEAAVAAGADLVHPGYGFLSENAELAAACAQAGITFVGPSPEVLQVFGDKGQARALAAAQQLPVLPGTQHDTSLADVLAFAEEQAPHPVLLKAVSGGGGRGVRIVDDVERLPAAFEEASAEARAAFGSGALYVERLLTGAFHVEVQVVGDGSGAVSHLWDRDCSVQRRHQKLIEVAPSDVLADDRRTAMLDAAVRLAAAVRLRGLATVEFLAEPDGSFFFLEVNPRLQVEHTVTEEVLGLDLVAAQLQLATGATLEEVGLLQADVPSPRGVAVQVRLNAETAQADGTFVPSAGRITRFDPPTGAGLRLESAVRTGSTVNPRFDSLLAKLVVHDRTGRDRALRTAARMLDELDIRGVDTNAGLQSAILRSEEVLHGMADTGWVDRNLQQLIRQAVDFQPAGVGPVDDRLAPSNRAGATDPRALVSPLGGVVVSVEAAAGSHVKAGGTILVVEAMKMQYPVRALSGGQVDELLVAVGDVVGADQPLALLTADDEADDTVPVEETLDLAAVRSDLDALRRRKALLGDAARPDAVAKRERLGLRTARQNVDDLTDGGFTVEYGGLAVAAQRGVRSEADLQARTPADGILTGLGRVNGAQFPADRSTCAVLAYDYTVLAGTQGYYSHKKTDRLLEIARQRRYPVVLFAEGGGGRPHDTDVPVVAGLNYGTFAALGRLSGVVPTIGIAAGRCFAGNAALLGTCDVVIATEGSNIGMGGPAMVEGGGLGTFSPEQIGPLDVQTANGVVDIAVPDEAAAVAAAKQYLSYFQGPVEQWSAADQRLLRHLLPEDRKRVYDVRAVVDTLFDVDSVLELRRGFGRGVVTALARLHGKPVGVVANDCAVLGGAIDADAADKMARFLQLCDAFALPVVSLCDTPGFMVGPESEKQATVRHFPRLFVLAGHMTVPIVTVVVRKAYGLGALGMAGGSFHATSATLAWPTAELGGMGLEGAVRLGARDALDAIEDPQERQRTFDQLVALAYERGSALNAASFLELDDVIDPADTRSVLQSVLLDGGAPDRDGWANARRRSGIDTW